MSVIYKQRYSNGRKERVPALNVQHLKYIATRPGVIYNEGQFGFGLWGRMESAPPGDIEDLEKAATYLRQESKTHTVFRAVVSLRETDAILKGYDNRESWQRLVTQKIKHVGESNQIELKNLRWFAAYHHERDHPHVHLMFWDTSDAVHQPYMPGYTFEKEVNKIRAAFNREIFADEIRALQNEQQQTYKEIRALTRNHVEGYDGLLFFDQEDQMEETAGRSPPSFYPKELSPGQAEELTATLERLIYMLPAKGQLTYKYLPAAVKEEIDRFSDTLFSIPGFEGPIKEYSRLTKEVAIAYGNGPSTVQKALDKKILELKRDVGNDLLKVIKAHDWRNLRDKEVLTQLSTRSLQELDSAIDKVVEDKLQEPAFHALFNDTVSRFPAFVTPREVVLRDEGLHGNLRAMSIDCMESPLLKQALQKAKAYEKAEGATGVDEPDLYKAAYRKIQNRLFDDAAAERGWEQQKQMMTAVRILHHLCIALRQPYNRHRSTANVLHRELSKQAKKEYAKTHQFQSISWE